MLIQDRGSKAESKRQREANNGESSTSNDRVRIYPCLSFPSVFGSLIRCLPEITGFKLTQIRVTRNQRHLLRTTSCEMGPLTSRRLINHVEIGQGENQNRRGRGLEDLGGTYVLS